MTRYLVFLLFFSLLAGSAVGMDLSLAPGLSVKNALLYSIVAGIAFESVVTHNRRIELVSVNAPFAALIAYALFTWLVVVLIVDYPGYRPFRTLIYFKSNFADHFLVFLVFFYGVMNLRDGLWLLRMAAWVVVFTNIVMVADVLNFPHLGLAGIDSDGRLTGPMGHSNVYGAFLVLTIPVTAALCVSVSGIARYLAFLGLMAGILALLMTVSRGAMVGLFVGCLAGAYLLRKSLPVGLVIRAAVGVAVVVLLAVAALMGTEYGPLLQERFMQSRGGYAHEITSGRTEVWWRAIARMLEQPTTFITGFGWMAYESFREFRYATHNTYLNLLFNLGLIGLTLFLVTAANAVAGLVRALPDAAHEAKPYLVAITIGLLSVLVAGFFSDLFVTWLYVWAFAGVALRVALGASTLPVGGTSSLGKEPPGPLDGLATESINSSQLGGSIRNKATEMRRFARTDRSSGQ